MEIIKFKVFDIPNLNENEKGIYNKIIIIYLLFIIYYLIIFIYLFYFFLRRK